MSSRIRIYDKTGKYLAEIDASCERTWKLNGIGSGRFSMSLADPKTREDYLQFGNYVLVEHEELPPFCGVIDVPRDWADGRIRVNMLSAEQLLKDRITGGGVTFSGKVGAIFRSLIRQGFSSANEGIVKTGDIYIAGSSRTLKYNAVELYQVVMDLRSVSGNDFSFEPEISQNGRLVMNANWHRKRGQSLPYFLQEGVNIERVDTPMVEQGTIRNYVLAYGVGATWAKRPKFVAQDSDSIDKYGLKAIGVAISTKSQATVKSYATMLLSRVKEPRKTFSLKVLPVQGAFEACEIGNTLRVSLYSVGFNGDEFGVESTVRIKEMHYDDSTNKLEIVSDDAYEEVE